jgi:hypothetical protein
MKPVEVRRELADALKLDPVGPSERFATANEVLSQAPSRWYLAGFLVPLDVNTRSRQTQTGASLTRPARDLMTSFGQPEVANPAVDERPVLKIRL